MSSQDNLEDDTASNYSVPTGELFDTHLQLIIGVLPCLSLN